MDSYIRPERSLKGKVAIVTGAGALGDDLGNGRAAAILMAADGCSVVCVDRDLAPAQRTVEMIEREGQGTAIAVQADVTSLEQCRAVVEQTIAKYGRLDILYNCVGVGGAPGTAVEVDMDEWELGLRVNVSSMVQMCKFAIPEMAKNDDRRGYRGSIINMGSVAGIKGGTPHLLYPTSKGAVVNLTRAMAHHHAGDGIRVNCVCPGMVYSTMMSPGMTAEARESRKNRSLLKTEGTAWDTAAAVRFLASEESRWITGVILPVDAGVTAAVGTDIPRAAHVNATK